MSSHCLQACACASCASWRLLLLDKCRSRPSIGIHQILHVSTRHEFARCCFFASWTNIGDRTRFRWSLSACYPQSRCPGLERWFNVLVQYKRNNMKLVYLKFPTNWNTRLGRFMPPQIVHRESFSCRANFSTERAPKAPTINMLGLHMPFYKVPSQRCKAALKTLPFTSESLLHILQDQFIQP